MQIRAAFCLLPLLACGGSTTTQVETPATYSFDQLPRLRFNQVALREGVPVHWFVDSDEDGSVDPDEIRDLDFYPTSAVWTENGEFTSAFGEAYARIVAAASAPAPTDARLAAVQSELENTAPTIVYNDLTALPEAHRTFAQHMLRVGSLIDALYAKQVGAAALASQVAPDAASQSLFRRNWGPRCLGAETASNEACSAIVGAPAQPVDIYPAAMQSDDAFCEPLQAEGADPALMEPFTVVRAGEEEGSLAAVPYTTEYATEMSAIAEELLAAAGAIESDESEAALVAYLRAAAEAFGTNVWGPADLAWEAMNARNSRWYVRVAPDEVYWDPCSRKAGFHMTFALIDSSSLEWQDRLDPIKADMEAALAALVETYEARDVQFKMPEFIAIVANAGDDRDAFGATIGQSLPNWGDTDGRTVAMSTLYTDPDSVARRRLVASSLLNDASMAMLDDDPQAGLMSTILHEATHNLGPNRGYESNGQTAAVAFGGEVASMMEELKAQTGALFFVEMLRERGIITAEQAQETYMDSIVWAFGHISRGMWSASGRRSPYSQLAAIQVGYLIDHGVLTWDADATPASGEGQGAFNIDLSNFVQVARDLMTDVMRIKSTGDRAAAIALADRYVGVYSGGGTYASNGAESVVPHERIVTLYRRFPRGTMVYSISL
ncbi:MAG: hypothetical protein AB8H86_27840 [Polyangiales bacterium]